MEVANAGLHDDDGRPAPYPASPRPLLADSVAQRGVPILVPCVRPAGSVLARPMCKAALQLPACSADLPGLLTSVYSLSSCKA